MRRGKYLAKNTAIFALGNIGTKAISFFIVCSCTFLEGDFVFKAVSTEEEVECFRGSKYVKSNPKGIYRKVKKLLQEKNKVLFIGLPCQIAAVECNFFIVKMCSAYCFILLSSECSSRHNL